MRVTTRLMSLLVMEAIMWSATVCEIVEGDILIPDTTSRVKSFSPTAKPTKTWTNGIVPVFIDRSNLKDEAMLNNITIALDTVSSLSGGCITFPDKTSSHSDYINITRIGSGGCYGSVGRIEGQQIINLAIQCGPVGEIMHEILHALGFWHEHSRTDRDVYVNITRKHILKDKLNNFKIRNETKYIAKDTAYDLKSIMHYKYDEFSILPGLWATILPKKIGRFTTDKSILGQRTYLTALDIEKIRWMYKCKGRGSGCEKPHSENLSISNTDQKQTYDVEDRVQFHCDTDYTLLGATSSVCKYNGQWAGALPICVKSTDINTGKVLYQDSDSAPKPWNTGWKEHRCVDGILSDASGPESDHTYSDANTTDGVFYYFNKTEQSEAEVSTRILVKGRETNLSVVLFYSMYGSNIDINDMTLEVKLIFISNWAFNRKVLWTRTIATEDRSWYCEHITGVAENLTGYYSISITAKYNGTPNNGNDAIIAIDDVMVGDATYVDKFAVLQQCRMLKRTEYDDPVGIGKTGMKIK